MTKLIDAVIVCTRNRPTDLARCLSTVNSQVRRPDFVYVIDSSDDAESRLLAEALTASGSKIHYVHTVRGLTKQRNVGLGTLDSSVDVVHFVDDDVEMDSSYFAVLLAAFESDPGLVGAGGMILGGVRARPTRAAVLGGRDSHTPGVVLPTGFNIGAHETPDRVPVDWLPGCSMSFRVAAIRGLKFDERRSGYAIGEDVDFGLKASARGRLEHVPGARLIHHLSPVNRHRRAEIARMAVVHRHMLALDRLGRVTRFGVIYGTIVESTTFFIRGIIHRNPDLVSIAWADLKGLIDILFRRRRTL